MINIEIPNTNNGIEEMFAYLKSELRNHNGLSNKRRTVLIDEYIKVLSNEVLQ
ncbi:MAG: hypothetical protein LKE30_05250 [Bacteroidales bacterium]|jgi:hypothetical protein|nr:hypothetical protein [Bacteroidales bacterium]